MFKLFEVKFNADDICVYSLIGGTLVNETEGSLVGHGFDEEKARELFTVYLKGQILETV
jgi:hypothetical protein